MEADIHFKYSGYEAEKFLAFDPGQFDEEQARCRSTRIVFSRKPHQCFRPLQGDFVEKPSGTATLLEKAIVDGEWKECRIALDDIVSYWVNEAAHA